MSKLTFRSNNDLKSLAKETLKHKKFNLPYTKKTTSKKGMFFVKDEGIYLMNAFKADNGKTPRENGFVVYASGYNPKTQDADLLWDKTYAVSRDDFGEFIHLSDDMLTRVVNGGNISVEVTETTIGVRAWLH